MRISFQYWRFFRYALPGLPLAALGLPFYIYAPLWLAEQGGYGYTLVGAIFFLARISDVVSDLPLGAWVDRRGSRRAPWCSH
jgi:GPH family glycoside/pentoside/hexuronide:cation symporter